MDRYGYRGRPENQSRYHYDEGRERGDDGGSRDREAREPLGRDWDRRDGRAPDRREPVFGGRDEERDRVWQDRAYVREEDERRRREMSSCVYGRSADRDRSDFGYSESAGRGYGLDARSRYEDDRYRGRDYGRDPGSSHRSRDWDHVDSDDRPGRDYGREPWERAARDVRGPERDDHASRGYRAEPPYDRDRGYERDRRYDRAHAYGVDRDRSYRSERGHGQERHGGREDDRDRPVSPYGRSSWDMAERFDAADRDREQWRTYRQDDRSIACERCAARDRERSIREEEERDRARSVSRSNTDIWS